MKMGVESCKVTKEQRDRVENMHNKDVNNYLSVNCEN